MRLGLSVLLLPGIWPRRRALRRGGRELSRLSARPQAATTRSARIVGRESGEGLIALAVLALKPTSSPVLAADIGGTIDCSRSAFSSRAPDPIWETGGSVLGTLGFWLFVPYAVTARFRLPRRAHPELEGWTSSRRASSRWRRAPTRRGHGAPHEIWSHAAFSQSSSPSLVTAWGPSRRPYRRCGVTWTRRPRTPRRESFCEPCREHVLLGSSTSRSGRERTLCPLWMVACPWVRSPA